MFSGNEAKISDLILLYNCPYKLSYILSDSVFINSVNWSLDIGITGVEEGTEEVLVVEEVLEEEGTKGIEEKEEEEREGEEGTEGIEEGREGEKGTEGIEKGTEEDDVNSDSDNNLKFSYIVIVHLLNEPFVLQVQFFHLMF